MTLRARHLARMRRRKPVPYLSLRYFGLTEDDLIHYADRTREATREWSATNRPASTPPAADS